MKLNSHAKHINYFIMKNISLLFLILFVTLNKSFATSNTKVFIITDDIKSERINKMSEIIYFEQNFKLDQFTFLTFNKSNEKSTLPNHKKKVVNIKQIRIDCNKNTCDEISSFIEFVNTSSNGNTKLFICEENNLNCNFQNLNIDVSTLIDKQYSTIAEKIKEEIASKKEKEKELILFFYISFKPKLITKSTLEFDKDTINMDQDESFKITPKYNQKFASYQWSPSTNLSCATCESPVFNGKESSTYTLICKDSLGCETKSKPIFFKINENCKLGNDCIRILFEEIETSKYVFKNNSGKSPYDWLIKANSSGGYQFDLVTSNNCATRYKVIIEDLKGSLIWSKEFAKDEVDKRSKNNYLDKYPTFLAFRLSLVSKQEIINEKEVRVRIISYDNKNNQYEECTSPRISFAPCN